MTMTKEQIQQIAIEVIGKLAVRLGADGSKGTLITVLTGATAEFGQAIDQSAPLSSMGISCSCFFPRMPKDFTARL